MTLDFDPEDYDPQYKCHCPMCEKEEEEEKDDRIQDAG